MEKPWRDKDGQLQPINDYTRGHYMTFRKEEDLHITEICTHDENDQSKKLEIDHLRIPFSKKYGFFLEFKPLGVRDQDCCRIEPTGLLRSPTKAARKKSLEHHPKMDPKMDVHYVINPKFNVCHTKDLIEKIKHAIKPGKSHIPKITKPIETDHKSTVGQTRYAPRIKDNPNDVVVLYKRHKRRNHHDRITDTGSRLTRKGNLHTESKRSLSEPRELIGKEMNHGRKESPAGTTKEKFRSNLPTHERDRSHSRETMLSRNNLSRRKFCRSKSSTDTRTDAASRLRRMADRKLNLHMEMMKSRRTVRRKLSKSSERSFFPLKPSEEPALLHQHISSEYDYQDLKTPTTRAPTQIKNQNPSPPAFQRKIFLQCGDKEELIQVTENDFTSKSTIRTEAYSALLFEQTVVNESEAEKPLEKLRKSENSPVEGLMCKLSQEIKKCSNFMKNLDKEGETMAVSSKSDSNILTWKPNEENASNIMKYKNMEFATYPLIMYPILERDGKGEDDGKVRIKCKCAAYKKVRMTKPPPEEQKPFRPLPSIQTGSTTSLASEEPRPLYRTHPCKRHRPKTADGLCCEECSNLKKRVVDLETEMEKIKKKVTCLIAEAEAVKKVPEAEDEEYRQKQYQEQKPYQENVKCKQTEHKCTRCCRPQQQQKCAQPCKQQEPKCAQPCKQQEHKCSKCCREPQQQQPTLQLQIQQQPQPHKCTDYCRQQLLQQQQLRQEDEEEDEEQYSRCHRHVHMHRRQQYVDPYQSPYQQNQRIAAQFVFPSKSSTATPVVQKSVKRDLNIKSSNSECQLNVGMEITMENVDPVTGEKLGGETNRSSQQEGNIQCRVMKDGNAPLLVMDTDFAYNPVTGMLFKNKDKSKPATGQTANLALPLENSQERISPPCSGRSISGNQNVQQAFTCLEQLSEHDSGTSGASRSSRKCVSLEHNPSGKIDVLHAAIHSSGDRKGKKSHSCERSVNREEREQSAKSSEKETTGKSGCKEKALENELRRCSRSSSVESKKSGKSKHGKSHIPTRKKPTPSSMGGVTSEGSTVSLGFSTRSSLPDSFSPTSARHSLAKLFSFTWTFGFFFCKLVHYMQSVSAICSVLTLTAMSLERYYAIVHPMKAQYICTISQARRIISGIWVSAFLLAVPILFAQVHLRVGVKVEAYWCVRDWDNKIVWRAHELYMLLLILVVPTGVMAVAYTAICWEICEVMQRRQDMTSGKELPVKKPTRNATENFPSFIYTNQPSRLGNKKRGRAFLKKELTDDAASVKQVIKMLVAIIVIYVICWGPMLIDNVLQAYGVLNHIRMGWLKYMGTAFHLMAYFNSCINPIIYGFMSKNFRESFRKTLCCMGRKQKMALRSFSLSQTRNTSIRYAESSFGRTVSIALPV